VTDLIEAVAAAMWKEDAMRAAPNVGIHRTPAEFAAQADPVRDRWRGYAVAALRAVADALPKSSVAPIRLSAGEPDQRPILGQRGAGLRKEPEPARQESVPAGHGFCRKCGAPMAEGIAMGQTYTPGSPDFPGDKEATTFSAGGPGEVIRALKCTACGWSVT
jgi:hypothetical protein